MDSPCFGPTWAIHQCNIFNWQSILLQACTEVLYLSLLSEFRRTVTPVVTEMIKVVQGRIFLNIFRPYNLAVRMTFKDSWFQCCGWREFWLVSIRLAYKSGSGIFVQEGSCVKLLASFWHQRLNVWDLLDWKTEAKSFEKVQLLVDMCLCAWRRRVVHFFTFVFFCWRISTIWWYECSAAKGRRY